MHFATQAIHVGSDPDPATGATVPPIYATSTYTHIEPGKTRGYAYSRSANPTRNNLEACLAALEGGAAAAAFASGLAASTAVCLALLRPGDSLVAFGDLYGGTYRLFERILRPWGVVPRYAEEADPAALAALVDNTTRMVWVETPTNPLLRVLDISGVVTATRAAHHAALARRGRPPAPDPAYAQGGSNHASRPLPAEQSSAPAPGGPFPAADGLTVVVDNTFATPALQSPLALGADLVVHSTTKYLGGHSDVIGGAVVTATAAGMEPIRFQQNAAGGVPGPFDCFLVHRGIKTLALRMERHCANARHIAEWATRQSAFSRVIYPGLASHPDHALAARQMRGGGGMVSCVLAGGLAAARKFLAATRLFSCAESLGGVESLISHPASMTHASMPPEVRERVGVVDGLVRLSVGLEDAGDLVEDLAAALRA